MRKSIIVIAALFAAFISLPLSAQEIAEIPEGYEFVDSLIYRPVEAVDTTLAGKDIFMMMPVSEDGEGANVTISQSPEVADAVRKHIYSNRDRTVKGYRVRIFFDNKQSARVASEEALKKFESLFHDVSAYRSSANPYFKVTVGDCRTKSEAMKLLARIKGSFPSAFVVKENIEYPVVDKRNAVIVDTIKVMRPKRK